MVETRKGIWMHTILHFDGSCDPNPGQMGIGFTIHSGDGRLLAEHSARLGVGTSNIAEYTALLNGLAEALRLGVRSIHVRGDSLLVVNAVLGKWRCKKPHLKPLLAQIMELVARFERFSIEHVGRGFNAHADRLSTSSKRTDSRLDCHRGKPSDPSFDLPLWHHA